MLLGVEVAEVVHGVVVTEVLATEVLATEVLATEVLATEDDRYGPWMLVTRRKPGQKRTNLPITTEDHTSYGLG